MRLLFDPAAKAPELRCSLFRLRSVHRLTYSAMCYGFTRIFVVLALRAPRVFSARSGPRIVGTLLIPTHNPPHPS
jgi:hypothetical protein